MGYLVQARDGVSPCIKEALSIWVRTQRRDKYPYISLNVANKMRKLVARGYTTEGVILTLTSLFYVPKVTYDIRMVFYATVSGLNDYLWDPKSMLTSMGSLIMMVGPEMHMVDLDAGEFFYIFRLSLVLTKYCGVDFGPYMGHKKYRQGTTLFMHWVCLMMGLVLSHYSAIQGILWASEVVRGDRSDPDNPFRWDKIMLNLPRDLSHPPRTPWMSKLRGGNQYLAAYFTTYMYDSIVAAGSEKEAQRASRRVGSIWKYLGLQYSPQKRSMDGQGGGP